MAVERNPSKETEPDECPASGNSFDFIVLPRERRNLAHQGILIGMGLVRDCEGAQTRPLASADQLPQWEELRTQVRHRAESEKQAAGRPGSFWPLTGYPSRKDIEVCR
jgi:hypothetical protein